MKWNLIFKSLPAIIVLFCSFFFQAKGQQVFTKEEAVEYAIDNSTEMMNARLDRRIASQQVRETRAVGLPQLDASLSMDYFADRPVQLFPADEFPFLPPGTDPDEEFEVSFGRDYDLSATATLNQLIFDGQYFVALQASREFQEMRDKEVEETERQIRENISKAYLQVVLADQTKDILHENIEHLETTLEETEALYENGFAEKLDVDRIKLRLNQVKTSHRDAERQQKNALERLKVQMGFPVEEEIATEDKDLETYKDETDIQIRPVEEVFQNRIEREVLKSRERVTALDRRRYRAGYLPSLSGFARHTQNAQRDQFDFFDQDENWYSSTTFGFTLNIPIFDGFEKNALINQKELEIEQIQNQRHLLEQSIVMEMEEAVNDYQSASEQLENQRENLELAEKIYDQTMERYREGIGESRDVTEAHTDMNQAQMDYLSAMLDLLIAEIDYEIATGTF